LGRVSSWVGLSDKARCDFPENGEGLLELLFSNCCLKISCEKVSFVLLFGVLFSEFLGSESFLFSPVDVESFSGVEGVDVFEIVEGFFSIFIIFITNEGERFSRFFLKGNF